MSGMRKNLFVGNGAYDHRTQRPLGVLVVNLGTPEAPTAEALKPYLKQFLWDARVIEYSRLPWWFILNLFILPTRPKKSAELYKKIWMPEGSPLLVHSRRQVEKLKARLPAALGVPVEVELGMRIGNPSFETALDSLRKKNIRQLLVLPMFPQYSSTTVGTVFDAVSDVLRNWRFIPEFRFITGYHDSPGYIEALANSVREHWKSHPPAEKLVMSFHGIPERYFLDGDPYFCLCHKTARLLAESLKLPQDKYIVTFQSLFGREEWIKPYTSKTLKELAAQGIRSVDVISPAFSVDCLETLEEIDQAAREDFLHAGGTDFRYIPALNDRDDFISAAIELIRLHSGGWLERDAAGDEREQLSRRVGKL